MQTYLVLKSLLLLFAFTFTNTAFSDKIYIDDDFKVIGHLGYDYAPSVMLENNKFKMYWCGESLGDQIFYSESDTYWKSWSKPRPVFRPGKTFSKNKAFDDFHVCDPSVVRARGKYYLYYGALPSVSAEDRCETKIGVAESLDGQNWVRINSGLPIVKPARKCPSSQYGAGQPSVVYLDGYFYMIYTDTSGFASKKSNGAGLYMIRSKSPTFVNREIRAPKGWVSASKGNGIRVTDYNLIAGFSVDMMYSDLIDSFVIAVNTNPNHTTLIFVDKNLSKSRPDMKINGTWRDGPGLIRKPNGHALPAASCDIIPVSLVRARGGKSPSTWDLYLTDAEIELSRPSCSTDQLQRAYSGFLITSQERPLAYVTSKGRIQLETRAPLHNSNYSFAYVDPETYDRFTYLGDINTSQKAISGRGLPSAFVTSKGYRIQYSCGGVISRNKSKALAVSSAQYHKYPLGGEIFCHDS